MRPAGEGEGAAPSSRSPWEPVLCCLPLEKQDGTHSCFAAAPIVPALSGVRVRTPCPLQCLFSPASLALLLAGWLVGSRVSKQFQGGKTHQLCVCEMVREGMEGAILEWYQWGKTILKQIPHGNTERGDTGSHTEDSERCSFPQQGKMHHSNALGTCWL